MLKLIKAGARGSSAVLGSPTEAVLKGSNTIVASRHRLVAMVAVSRATKLATMR